MARLTTPSLLAALLGLSLSSTLPAAAQYLYPDGSVRKQYGVIQSGPDARRLLPVIPSQERYLDRNNGSIYDGNGVLRYGPNPSRTLPTWTGGW